MISFDSVTRRFGSTVAVDDFSCEFASGKTHVLLGSSGCGKTTLLRMVLGLVSPDSGKVTVGGQLMSASLKPTLTCNMGYVVQEGGLFPHLSVLQNVTLGAEARKWTV
ncbi:MAG: ATP-binding cassette domain-containing protein, partial [Gammaproteobacteria bacterium]|nr:ATP-binding cassette domain-containing protein [Gammaproteobacteria bacterium]